MTIANTTDKVLYNGDGSTTTFPYTFEVLVNTDLLVQLKNNTSGVITTQVLNSDYTMTGAGISTGGNVVFSVAPATGNTIIILRNMSILQPLNLLEYSTFASGSVNTAFDRITMIAQQLNEVIGRQVVFDPTLSNTFNTVLPLPNLNNAFLGLNSTATGWQFTQVTPGGGIASLNADHSPQLGGNLDINGYHILDSSSVCKYIFNSSATNPAQLLLQQTNGTKTVALSAPATLSTSIKFTLPVSIPGSTGQLMTSDTSGNLSFITGTFPSSPPSQNNSLLLYATNSSIAYFTGTVGQHIRIGTTANSVTATTAMHFENVQVYTSGSGTFSIPADVTRIFVKAWGGGGGGTAGVAGQFGCGGGGGAYLEGLFAVTAGGSLSYAVGAAGAAGVSGVSAATAGGDSTLSGGGLASTLTAGGGAGGNSTSATSSSNVAGGTATNGNINITGGTSGSGGSSGAGAGGNSPNGGQGGPGLPTSNSTVGQAGIAPGGGGGGPVGPSNGGAGAAGMIVIYY